MLATVNVKREVVKATCHKAKEIIGIVRKKQEHNNILLYQLLFNKETFWGKILTFFGASPKKYTFEEAKAKVDNHIQNCIRKKRFFYDYDYSSCYCRKLLDLINILYNCSISDIEEPIVVDAEIWNSILAISNLTETEIEHKSRSTWVQGM